ncbi:MAG: hypothetical protein RLZZ387_933 [Chloroflexota bacterium]
MKTIIVPLDGSTLAEQVLPYVELYASLLHAEVVLVRVVTDEEQQQFRLLHAADASIRLLPLPEPPHEVDVPLILAERARAYLDTQMGCLQTAGLSVAVSVRTGSPAEAIAEVASRYTDPLIMLATHGYSGLRRWTLGSTADRVVHIANVPVFVVRARAEAAQPLTLRRVLVPLDGSALAAQALPVALELAGAARAELILLQAVLPFNELAPAFAPLGRPIPMPVALLDEEHERVRRQLRTMAEQLSRPELTVTPAAELGYPADVILDEAEKYHADLIVLATHGRSGLRHWVLGSVADKVLHATRTPLLLVRASDA